MSRQFQIVIRLFLLLLILTAGSFLSFKLRTVTDSLLLYLPNALSIVLVHWLGWRILPVIYLNGIATLVIWGAAGSWLRIGLVATHEPVIAFTSWLLFARLFPSRDKTMFESTDSFFRFVVLGIIIPVSVNSLYVYHYTFVNGDMQQVFLIWLSDFITMLPLSIPLLHFFRYDSATLSIKRKENSFHFTKESLIEILLASLLFIVLSFVFPFDRYWFIYGIGATLVALRKGFETVLVINVIIFFLSYLFPLFDFASALLISHGSTQFINVHLGMSTMLFVSVLVGRVVSDLTDTEEKLRTQKAEVENANRQLSQVNRELDRFVYSVSHDLSAPLKSIKGLVTVSRMEPQSFLDYLDKIEKSVNRLEDFIDEVLDYSRTNRKELFLEDLNLREIISEVNDKFHYLDQFNKISFKLDLEFENIRSDRFLVRVILSNLLSNAIKYQKKYEGHNPEIGIRSFYDGNYSVIEITDNGEGIPNVYQSKIFDMFYRGTVNSSGSGLGLYITKEAVQKLNGEITVKSTTGEGSVFRIQLPKN